jgi:hypothetical protein
MAAESFKRKIGAMTDPPPAARAPRGKRQLPVGVRCVRPGATISPRHDRVVRHYANQLQVTYSDMLRRMIDAFDRAQAAPAFPLSPLAAPTPATAPLPLRGK